MNGATDYYVSLPPLIGTFALVLIVGKQPNEISTQTNHNKKIIIRPAILTTRNLQTLTSNFFYKKTETILTTILEQKNYKLSCTCKKYNNRIRVCIVLAMP